MYIDVVAFLLCYLVVCRLRCVLLVIQVCAHDGVVLFVNLLLSYRSLIFCLQCFDAVGWVARRASGLYKTE